jgi:hypothetical protein
VCRRTCARRRAHRIRRRGRLRLIDRCGARSRARRRRPVDRWYKMGLPVIAVVEFNDLFGSRDLAFVPAGEYSVRGVFNGRKARHVPHCQNIKLSISLHPHPLVTFGLVASAEAPIWPSTVTPANAITAALTASFVLLGSTVTPANAITAALTASFVLLGCSPC